LSKQGLSLSKLKLATVSFAASVLQCIMFLCIFIIPIFYFIKCLYSVQIIALNPQKRYIFLSIGTVILFICLVSGIFTLIGLCISLYREHFKKPLIYFNIVIAELIIIKMVIYPILGI